MTVGDLLDRTTSAELSEWEAYFIWQHRAEAEGQLQEDLSEKVKADVLKRKKPIP